ncbi:mpv17-like protein [Ceratitis capitata]|uniref:Mitochondrial inner membrane protein Mpv17 n=1 Tax=Ceratitis capitata TaxID=7213 RepID=W8BM42_CERCA|nr:mpv17-like protein [Ceratitis capitata]
MSTSIRALITEGIRVGAIMGAGDALCQTWVENRELRNLDVNRMLRFASVGVVYVGPALKIWYGALDKIVSKSNPPMKRALKKMAIDQTAFAPAFIASLIGIFGLINGETTTVIKERFQNDYLSILSRNYMLWPAAQVINFSLVPLNYQVLYAQFVSLIWNTYLSMKLNDEQK